MSAAPRSPKSVVSTDAPRAGLQLKHVLILFVLAATAWGFNFWSERQQAPIREHLAAGQKYFDSGQVAPAVEEWRRVVELSPQNVEAWQSLGQAYVRLNDWKNAYDALQHVEKLDSSRVGLYSGLAAAAAKLQDNEAARRYAEMELKRDADARDALRVMVKVLELQGDEEARLTYLQRLAKLEPENVDTLILLSDSLIGLNHYEEARPFIERLLSIDPTLGAAYSMRGVVEYESGGDAQSLGAARRDLEKALQINANDSVSRLYLGKVLLRAREPKKAIENLQIVGQSPTANPVYLFEMGNAHRQLGQPAEAQKWLRRFEEVQKQNTRVASLRQRYANNPQDFETVLQLALALMDSEQPLGAEKNLEIAKKLKPNDPRVKAAEARLEKMYEQHLQQGLRALQKNNQQQANWHITKAAMLKPRDERTQSATQQLAAAGSGNQANSFDPRNATADFAN